MGLDILKTELISKTHSLLLQMPIFGASGTYGYVGEFENYLDENYKYGIVTKGLTLEERQGNSGDRIFETTAGMINRIGLENIGIERFLDEKLPDLKTKNIDFILNIAGSCIEDYEKLAEISNKNGIKAVEVNVSCPNVKSGCLEFGKNPEALKELVSLIRSKYDGFLIVKLSPNVSDIKPLVAAAESAGADCISAINTVHGLGVKLKFNGNLIIKNSVQGGLSGRCIKPVALYYVNQIRSVTNLPIIGIGGISCLDDILEFISVGADCVQVGTENFTNPSLISDLAKDLHNFILKQGFKDFDDLKHKIRGSINGKC